MTRRVPATPKIYHIVNVDKLPSIISEGCLWCDSEGIQRVLPGTTIGMDKIKQRRLNELKLCSHPDLFVGDCVPFYFCPRSIMLYLIHQRNPELSFKGGQGSIIHLESDLRYTVDWANDNDQRWAFTLSNAAAYAFEDRCDLAQLHEIDWPAVQARNWRLCKHGKQAEFLLERSFPWELVSRIGVHSQSVYQEVAEALRAAKHRPQTELKPEWYY